MWNTIYDEDPSAQIFSGYIAKEELRTVLSTVRCGGAPTAPAAGCIASSPGASTRNPRTDHPGQDRGHLVVRDQRVRADRDNQRPHRGHQPARETDQTLGLRIPQSRQQPPPGTVELHPDPPGSREIQAIMDGYAVFDVTTGEWAGNLRDRLLFALLAESGMRIGEALGLRISDFVMGRGGTPYVEIVPRSDNTNGARVKMMRPRRVYVGSDLERLSADYLTHLACTAATLGLAVMDHRNRG